MYPKKHIKIKGKEMAYVDEGQGDPIVFLHGNPTSSYLWRNIAPHVEGLGRIVIPDLIGMGDSEKLNNIDDPGYKYHGQYNYLTSLLEELNLGNNINLVIHDWGSAMGFQFARENSERIKSITFMEAIVMPMVWDQWPEMARKIFGLYRSEAGEELILEKNYFVEKILFLDAPNLTEDDKNEYRRIEYDLPVQLAKIAKFNSISNFIYVSSIGANPKASSTYLKNKGQVEEELKKIGFSNLSIIQPSFLVGNRKDFRIVEVLGIPVMKFLSLFFFGGFKKYTPIKVEIVVNAMIKLASGNNSEQTYLSDRLQELGSN